MSDSVITVPEGLAMCWSRDWTRYRFNPDQSLVTSLRVIRVKGEETVNHGYRRNLEEPITGVVGEKIPKGSDMLGVFRQGVPDMGHVGTP